MTTPHFHCREVVQLLAAAVVISAAPGVHALTDDSVAVLPAGGTNGANVYSLRGSDDKLDVVEEDHVRLVADELGPAAFTDFKLLPRNRRLLADFGDRGLATTDEDGAITFALAAPGDRPGFVSASAAGFDDLQRPTRLLYGSNAEQQVAIYDLRSDSTVWSKTLTRPAVAAKIVQTIALPEHRVALAANWPSAQTSGIDIYDLAAENSQEFAVRFANQAPGNSPGNVVTDEAITDIHDLFALSSDKLLVTTAHALLVLSIEQQAVTDRLTLSAKPEFAGEFISARALPSGRIAAATVEPGFWTESHPNHRIYWLDDSLSTIVARTSSLNRAPWKVEPAKGHGGSGTSGFSPDSTYLPSGTADDLALAGQIEILPEPARIGNSGQVRARLANTGPEPVFVNTAAILAKPGGCDTSREWRTLVETTDSVVAEQSQRDLQGPYQPPDDATTGSWCARVRVEDRAGNRRFVGDPETFEIVDADSDAGSGTGRRIEPVDLGLRYTADASDADTADEPSVTTDPRGGGCGCRATTPRSPGPLLALLIAAGAAALRRRRRS